MTQTLEAAKFDGIVARADELGGVGSGRLLWYTAEGPVPCCLYGIAGDIGLYGPEGRNEMYSSADGSFYNRIDAEPLVPGLHYTVIDNAVQDLRVILGLDYGSRVPVRKLLKDLGVERGE
jgi:hypothetical protein